MRKTIIILLCALSLHLSAQRVNLHYNNTPISAILKQLNSEQHNYAINFIYNELEDFHVTTDIKNKTIPDAIRQMIGFYPIKMTTMDENILLVECIQKAALHYSRICKHHTIITICQDQSSGKNIFDSQRSQSKYNSYILSHIILFVILAVI